MDNYTAAVAIVSVIFVAQVLNNWIKHRGTPPPKKDEAMEKRVSGLEDRIRNLESILIEREKESKFDRL